MFKSVVIPVVVKNSLSGILVHTQTRRVINKSYDSLYDGTQETCGESLKDWEGIGAAAVRGCREELGLPDLQPKIIGLEGQVFSTRPDQDQILWIPQPFCFIQQLQGPQPWFGLGCIAVVPPDCEPQQDAEGETAGHKWWKPEELNERLKNNPSEFMGLHYPVLRQVCEYYIRQEDIKWQV